MERVVLLTGKMYYDLVKERAAREQASGSESMSSKVAFVRLEELAPFPFQALRDTLGRYSGAREVCWLQEEPRNQGAWTHVGPRIKAVLEQMQMQDRGEKWWTRCSKGRRRSSGTVHWAEGRRCSCCGRGQSVQGTAECGRPRGVRRLVKRET